MATRRGAGGTTLVSSSDREPSSCSSSSCSVGCSQHPFAGDSGEMPQHSAGPASTWLAARKQGARRTGTTSRPSSAQSASHVLDGIIEIGNREPKPEVPVRPEFGQGLPLGRLGRAEQVRRVAHLYQPDETTRIVLRIAPSRPGQTSFRVGGCCPRGLLLFQDEVVKDSDGSVDPAGSVAGAHGERDDLVFASGKGQRTATPVGTGQQPGGNRDRGDRGGWRESLLDATDRRSHGDGIELTERQVGEKVAAIRGQGHRLGKSTWIVGHIQTSRGSGVARRQRADDGRREEW